MCHDFINNLPSNPLTFLSCQGATLTNKQIVAIQSALLHAAFDGEQSLPGFDVVIDSGCSVSMTAHISDFEPGTLVPLAAPIYMTGIAGGLSATHEGMLCYKTITSAGSVFTLCCPGFLIDKLPVCLLSPQPFLNSSLYCDGCFCIRKLGTNFTLSSSIHLLVHFQTWTMLPVLQGHH